MKLLAILRCEFVVSKREKGENRVYRCCKYHGLCCCASMASFSCVDWMEVDVMCEFWEKMREKCQVSV